MMFKINTNFPDKRTFPQLASQKIIMLLDLKSNLPYTLIMKK